MRGSRVLTVGAAAAAALGLMVAPAGAKPLNVVVASSWGFGPHVVERAAFDIDVLPARPFVVQRNAAFAQSAYCAGCVAEAAAFDVVLFSGDPHVVSVDNSALALQVACRSCATVAYATQIVVGGPGLTLDQAGRDALVALGAQTRALVAGDLAGAALVAALDRITLQIVAIIQAHASVDGAQVAATDLTARGAAPGLQILTSRKVDTDPARP
jgi:hypothetical protein